MNSNLSVTSYKPSFGIKVNKRFIDAVHNYYNDVEYRPRGIKPFDDKVKEVIGKFGYDEFEFIYKKEHKGGALTHCLYAVKEGMDDVLITKKDQLRKVIDKFKYLTKHELYTKIHQAQVQQGLK